MNNNGLWHHFQLGGWSMWPVCALGLLSAAAAARFAWRGEHPLLGFLRWLSATVLACGAFGFFLGMMRALSYIVSRVPPERQVSVLLEGLAEALNNVTAALLFTVLTCLLVAIGYRRFPAPNPSAMLP